MRSTIFGLILIIAGQLSAATPEQSYRQIIPAVAHTEGVGGSSLANRSGDLQSFGSRRLCGHPFAAKRV